MANFDTATCTKRRYRRLPAMLAICAFGAAGTIGISHMLWQQPFGPAPDSYGTLSVALVGFGFVLESFESYALRKSREKLKLGVASHYLYLLLVGIFFLCLAIYFAYTNFKARGY